QSGDGRRARFLTRVELSAITIFFRAGGGIRARIVAGVQTCALPIFDVRKRELTLYLVFVDIQCQLALAHVDGDGVTIFNQPNDSAVSRLRGDVADGQDRGTTGEAAISNQSTCLAQTRALEE